MALPRTFAAAQGPPGRCKHRPLQGTPSGSAPGIKTIRRGGIYPSRTPAATGTPRFSAGHKMRPNQAPLSKGARAEIGGLPSGKMPFPGARRTAAIQNRDVRAAAGSGGMRASRPTVARVAAPSRPPATFAPVCRGGFHIRPRTFPPPQTGPIWNRPLHGFVITRGRGHPGCPQHKIYS